MDPGHTAYLEWPLLVRHLVVPAVPGLPLATPAQLVQLKQRLQQADSDADGLLTEPELMSVDMGPLLTAPAAPAAPAEEAGEAQDSLTSSTAAGALDGSAAAQNVSTDGGDEALADAGIAGGLSAEQSLSVSAAGEQAAGQLKGLLFQMCKSSASGDAAVNIEDILLYLCCDTDGPAGLSKAFAVVTDSQADGKVSIMLDVDFVIAVCSTCLLLHCRRILHAQSLIWVCRPAGQRGASCQGSCSQ